MAQKAFIITQDPPTINSGNFRLNFTVVFCDSSTGDAFIEAGQVDVSASLLSSARVAVRNEVKSLGSSLHSFNLTNDDIYFEDWSRELI